MGSIGNSTIPDTQYTNATDFRRDLEQYFTLNRSSRRGQYIVIDENEQLGVIRFSKDLGYSTVALNTGGDSWTSYNNLKSAVNALRGRR